MAAPGEGVSGGAVEDPSSVVGLAHGILSRFSGEIQTAQAQIPALESAIAELRDTITAYQDMQQETLTHLIAELRSIIDDPKNGALASAFLILLESPPNTDVNQLPADTLPVSQAETIADQLTTFNESVVGKYIVAGGDSVDGRKVFYCDHVTHDPYYRKNKIRLHADEPDFNHFIETTLYGTDGEEYSFNFTYHSEAPTDALRKGLQNRGVFFIIDPKDTQRFNDVLLERVFTDREPRNRADFSTVISFDTQYTIPFLTAFVALGGQLPDFTQEAKEPLAWEDLIAKHESEFNTANPVTPMDILATLANLYIRDQINGGGADGTLTYPDSISWIPEDVIKIIVATHKKEVRARQRAENKIIKNIGATARTQR